MSKETYSSIKRDLQSGLTPDSVLSVVSMHVTARCAHGSREGERVGRGKEGESGRGEGGWRVRKAARAGWSSVSFEW